MRSWSSGDSMTDEAISNRSRPPRRRSSLMDMVQPPVPRRWPHTQFPTYHLVFRENINTLSRKYQYRRILRGVLAKTRFLPGLIPHSESVFAAEQRQMPALTVASPTSLTPCSLGLSGHCESIRS